MTKDDPICRDAILAVLREVRDAGLRGVTRTALVKFAYLLDVFVAEETQGRAWTSLEWKFLHYGPYSFALDDCFGSLERDAMIEVNEKSAGDKEFFLYQLSDRMRPKNFIELGVPNNAAGRLGQAIRDFAYALPKLLDYVYFHTAPMVDAFPSETLRFDKCGKIDYKKDVRPLKLLAPDAKKIELMKRLVTVLREKDRPLDRPVIDGVILDEHYLDAMAVGDLDGFDRPDAIVASLQFPDRNDNANG